MGAENEQLEDCDRGYSQLMQDVPVSELRNFTLNRIFLRRIGGIIYCGVGSPKTSPWLWLVLLVNLVSQFSGAYLLQDELYILATGIDDEYPGISGCLKNGCNGVASPGESSYVNNYIGRFMWLFFISMALLLLMSYTGDALNALMRKNIAKMFHQRLLNHDTLLYRLTVDGSMDNIDQRITSDVQVTLDGLCCVLYGNSADYLAYPAGFMITRAICALINIFMLPDVRTDDKRGKIIAMVIASMTIAVVAYILPVNHVCKIFFRGQRYEGDFRTTHTRAILGAEQIATLRGEEAELDLAALQFRRLDRNNKLYYSWQSLLLILRLLITVSIPACSYICLAITETNNSTTANFFQKQVGDVFEYFLYFPVFVERMAFACGATHRVGQLIEEMSRFAMSPVPSHVEHSDDCIELRRVRANPPLPLDTKVGSKSNIFGHGGRLLFEDVNFAIKHGESICIIGPSGCGKSSLLRILCGLWGIDDGVVVKPKVIGRGGLFFLPQKPYVFPGNLMQQVIYPLTADTKGSGEVMKKVQECLRLVYLEHILQQFGLSQVLNWSDVLSFGEMQQLNFARMFYHEPAFCLADECTSALDLRLESFLYAMCAGRKISMISIAHRPSVIPHHHFVLQYESDTHSWTQVKSATVAGEKVSTDGLLQQPASLGLDFMLPPEVNPGLGCTFLKRFLYIMKLTIGKCYSQVFLIFFLQAICMSTYGGLTIEIFQNYGTSVIIALITGTNPYTLATRNLNVALDKCGNIIGMNVIISFCQAISCFVGAWLAIKVQRCIVRTFHKIYFSPGVVYHINRLMNERGLDQRMVQDLSGLREAFAWLFGNPFAYCNYRVGFAPLSVVWVICLSYSFKTGWQLSLFMWGFMMVSFMWQIVASIATSKQVGSRQALEGDLRLHLCRTLQNIETITFFRGQRQELDVANNLMDKLFRARLRYYGWSNLTSLPTISMYYWLQTGIYVMAAVVAIWWAPGQSAVNSTNLFTTINFNITWAKMTQLMIQCLGGLGMLIGFTHRVVYALERLVQASKSAQSTQNAIKRSDDSIAFERVVVRTPSRKGDGKTLVENLNVKVNDSLAVSGVGKSSVMRVLAGLWKPESGSVSRPEIGSGGIFFVPQGNYTVQGTLAAQVVYPKLLSETTADPDEIASILEEVGLDALVKRWGLNRVVNWDMILSGGESQRLGFARVIFHHPRFAVLDETTSALDMATEYKCMQALKRHGIKCISFAARPSIAAYHDGKLELEPSVGNNLSRRTTNRSIRSVNTTASKILSFESGDVTGL